MKTYQEIPWFIYHSWFYMGCDRGTGRWSARRTYLRKLIPATRTFVRLRHEDAKHG